MTNIFWFITCLTCFTCFAVPDFLFHYQLCHVFDTTAGVAVQLVGTV